MSKELICYQNALLSVASLATGDVVYRADCSASVIRNEQRLDARRVRDSSNPDYTQYGYPNAAPRYPDGSHQHNGSPHYPVDSNAYPGAQHPYHGGSHGMAIPQGYPSGGYYPPPTTSHSSATGPLISHWRTFLTNQRVQVNIEGYGWLVGTVVAMLGAVQAVSAMSFGTVVSVTGSDKLTQVTGAFVRVRYSQESKDRNGHVTATSSKG
ncbi:hypothetical protein JR316_0005879 [Psilocybe cubensis]|uniref:Uncharacterized protein n=2 Tax=Psilocybe cubensis TaxID=181762 RepID=A0A8H7Y2W0_PSICU|nr:hypothetical protein JR316_0005879 [Psilocybe cubensis]KAH9481354.1 hypothetical protein JR316_0005879 [Psilocybe cubensis]